MRTVHTYTPSTQQQQQASTSPDQSTGQQVHQQNSPISGFSSVRQCLLRMHSQLQSASNQQTPMDLSHNHHHHHHHTKIATRSMTTTTAAGLRSQPIITSSATTPTRTFYGNIASSTATNEQIAKILTTPSSDFLSKSNSNQRPALSLSPKLAYARSNIDESLQCALCIDRLRDPRALPCQHVFCCSCLNSIHSFAPPNGATIACPLCRRVFPFVGADKFPLSYIHRTLLELTPTNYTIHAKCGKCQDKQPLSLCTCCDYLLCQICAGKDRQKLLDNIEHIVQTCHYRLKRIHHTRDQLYANCQGNVSTIKQIETAYDNLERKLAEQKRFVLNRLHRYSEQITETFWSKLQIPGENTTEPIIDLLKQADQLLRQSQQTKFDDILSLFYNLSSMAEQLEQANSLIDTCDVQTLLKNNIFLSGSGLGQIRVHLTKFDQRTNDEILSLLPPSLLPVSSLPVSTRQRPRKTEPKRLIQEIEDDDDDDDEEDKTTILKRMKTECHDELLIHLDDSIPSNEQEEHLFESIDDNDDDNDIVYLETIQKPSPPFSVVDQLLQIVDSN